MADQKEKAVLAYSGGLDTSCCIKWLQENKGVDVIAVVGDVGQEHEGLEKIKQKALKSGALDCLVVDMRDTFAKEYLAKALAANAMYENKYPLVSALSRPLISKHLVDAAHKYGAKYIAHGCTGKGNDQVRFELALKALAPEMQIIAPWREWSIKSREEEIEYAEAHNIPLKINRETNYSKDKNVWHLSHEGLDLENPANEPQYLKDGFLELGVAPEKAPEEPTYITLHFEKGVPTAIDGKDTDALEIVETLNDLGGKNGIGLLDIVENRLVGMKSRGVYETPGGTILYKAHELLEMITLDRDTSHYKKLIAQKYGELVYNGMWFSPLREALDAFVDKTQETVTGDVKLKLYKGNVMNAGVTSPYTLYDENVASFGDDGGAYNQADATGFINLFGLSTKVKALLDKNRNID